MDDALVARILHVLGVILWIGGVGFVTTTLLPAIRRHEAPERGIEIFERLERRFAWQARGTTVLVGASGFYLTWVWNLWERFAYVQFWWMHAMVILWGLFTVMLFLAEPLFLHRWFLRAAKRDPDRAFRLIERLHWVLLLASLVTVAGAVAGSHGFGF